VTHAQRCRIGNAVSGSVSVGVMAPTLAVSITGVQPARLIHLWPVPASPFDVFPYIVAAWPATGVIVSRFV
jgi:hypothetical protein